MNMTPQQQAALMLSKLNPSRAKTVVRADAMQGATSAEVINLLNGGGMGAITQSVRGSNDCCPSGGKGLPTLLTARPKIDACKGTIYSNVTTNIETTITNYQRTSLIPDVNWLVNSNAPTALVSPSAGPNAFSVDGLIFWIPATQNVALTGFMTIRVQGIRRDSGSGATVNDFDFQYQAVLGQNNGPALTGALFRTGNASFTPTRIQSAGAIAQDVNAAAVTVPAQNLTVTITGFPANVAPIQVFPINSTQSWITPYSRQFAQKEV